MELLPSSITAACAILLFFLLHWALWRAFPDRFGVTMLGRLTVLSYAAAAILAKLLFNIPFASHAWVSVPLVAFVSISYVRFYLILVRTLTLRILEELLETPGGRLTLRQLEDRYPRERMFTTRLDLLVKNGWLRCTDSRYTATPKGYRIGMLITVLRRIYRIEKAG